MKIKHRLSVLLVPVLLFLLISPTFVVSGVDLPSPTQTFYVNDFASILSEETEDHLLQTNDLLEPQTGAQIVTVTVDFLDGLNSEEYAYQLFNDWGIGSKEENNGVLLLLSPIALLRYAYPLMLAIPPALGMACLREDPALPPADAG